MKLNLLLLVIALAVVGFCAMKFVESKKQPAPQNKTAATTRPLETAPSPTSKQILPEKIAQTQKCSSESPVASYALSTEQIVFLYSADNSFKVKVDPKVSCFHTGQSLILTQARPEDPDFHLFRARAFVDSITTDGTVVMKPTERWLGTEGLLPNICYTFCDAVIEALPTRDDVLFLIKGPDVDLIPEPMRKYKPIVISDEDAANLDALQKATGPVAGRYIVVAALGPQSPNWKVIPLMRLLKTSGAKQVDWYYKGISGKLGIPVLAPAVPNIAEPQIADLSIELKTGTKPLLSVFKGETVDSIEGALPGSIAVETSHPALYPTTLYDEANYERNVNAINKKSIPVGLHKRYLVYGRSSIDWRPRYLAIQMWRMGYTNVVYFRGGISELNEARALKVAAP